MCSPMTVLLEAQERLEDLKQRSYEASLHDSTLKDVDKDDRSLEERYLSSQKHLAAFQDSLAKLKQSGGSIPGFDGIETLLEDPKKAGAMLHLAHCLPLSTYVCSAPQTHE
jgi:hypothetical protein